MKNIKVIGKAFLIAALVASSAQMFAFEEKRILRPGSWGVAKFLEKAMQVVKDNPGKTSLALGVGLAITTAMHFWSWKRWAKENPLEDGTIREIMQLRTKYGKEQPVKLMLTTASAYALGYSLGLTLEMFAPDKAERLYRLVEANPGKTALGIGVGLVLGVAADIWLWKRWAKKNPNEAEKIRKEILPAGTLESLGLKRIKAPE